MKFSADFNFNSKEWIILEHQLRDELNNAVGSLCNLECEPDRTQQLRGRIAFIKSLLAGAEAAVKERQR